MRNTQFREERIGQEPAPTGRQPPAGPGLYQPPRLQALGDIRELTLGGSLGTGDSGNAGVQRF